MNANFWTAVAAISQATTVLVAGVALIYARGQVKEARETRERVAQPEVVVYVDHHKVRRYMDLVIKNFGQSTAYNIRLTLPPLLVAPFTSRLTGEEVTSLWVPETIAVLAPGQEWRTVWDSAARREDYFKKYKKELQWQFVGDVKFDDKVNPEPKRLSYCNPISLDIKMFWNTTWIERSENKSVEAALYDIASTLESYTEEHNGLWVYTETGQAEREYHRQLADCIAEQHNQTMRALGVYRDTPAIDSDDDGPDD